MAMTFAEFLALLSSGGPLALLAMALWSLFQGWVVTRGQYEAMLGEKDRQIGYLERSKAEWKTLALRGTALAEELAELTPIRRQGGPGEHARR